MKLEKETGIKKYLENKKEYDELNKLNKEELIERYLYRLNIAKEAILIFSVTALVFAIITIILTATIFSIIIT